MENQDQNKEFENSKLTGKEFFKQLDILLRSAPDEVVFFVTALENPESDKKESEAIFSTQGKPKHVTYSLFRAFNYNHHFKDIVYTAVDVEKTKDRMTGAGSDLGLGALGILASVLRK